MKRAMIWCMASMVAGCGHAARETKSTGESAEPRARAPSELLADRIDPGVVTPLVDDMPPWIADELGVHAEAGMADTSFEPELALALYWYATEPSTGEMGYRLFQLFRYIGSRERALGQLRGPEALPTLLELHLMYEKLAVDAVALDQHEFLRMVIEEWGVNIPAPKRAEALRFTELAIARAPKLRDHALARMLRVAAPDDPMLVSSLSTTARRIPAGARSDLKIALYRAAIRSSETPDVFGWLELAEACFTGLDLSCGDESMRAAKHLEAPEGAAARFAAVAAKGKSARRALELADATEIDDRIERARALLDLDRVDDAEKLFAALARTRPRDARVIAGVAEARFRRNEDLERLPTVLEPTATLEHRDTRVHALALTLRSYRLQARMGGVLPADAKVGMGSSTEEFERLIVDARALEDANVAQGAAVRVVAEALLPAMRTDERTDLVRAVRTLLPEATKVQSRFPGSADPYRVLLASTAFSTDPDAVFRALEVDVPDEQHDELATLRLHAKFDAMVSWDRFEDLGDLFDEANAAARTITGPRLDHARLMFDLMYARARFGTTTWSNVADEERAFLEGNPVADPTLVNAVGVAMVEAGDRALGVDLLRQARELGDGAPGFPGTIPTLNLVALGEQPLDAAEALAVADDVQIRVIALGLLATKARGAARKRWRRELVSAHAEQCTSSLRGRPTPSVSGLVLGERFDVRARPIDGTVRYEFTIPPIRGQLVDAAVRPLTSLRCR